MLCEGCPDVFVKYLRYCRELEFSETPDYGYLRGLFQSLFRSKGFIDDGMYDWVVKASKMVHGYDFSRVSFPSHLGETATKLIDKKSGAHHHHHHHHHHGGGGGGGTGTGTAGGGGTVGGGGGGTGGGAGGATGTGTTPVTRPYIYSTSTGAPLTSTTPSGAMAAAGLSGLGGGLTSGMGGAAGKHSMEPYTRTLHWTTTTTGGGTAAVGGGASGGVTGGGGATGAGGGDHHHHHHSHGVVDKTDAARHRAEMVARTKMPDGGTQEVYITDIKIGPDKIVRYYRTVEHPPHARATPTARGTAGGGGAADGRLFTGATAGGMTSGVTASGRRPSLTTGYEYTGPSTMTYTGALGATGGAFTLSGAGAGPSPAAHLSYPISSEARAMYAAKKEAAAAAGDSRGMSGYSSGLKSKPTPGGHSGGGGTGGGGGGLAGTGAGGGYYTTSGYEPQFTMFSTMPRGAMTSSGLTTGHRTGTTGLGVGADKSMYTSGGGAGLGGYTTTPLMFSQTTGAGGSGAGAGLSGHKLSAAATGGPYTMGTSAAAAAAAMGGYGGHDMVPIRRHVMSGAGGGGMTGAGAMGVTTMESGADETDKRKSGKSGKRHHKKKKKRSRHKRAKYDDSD